MKPDHFRDIIATNALYRPGPLEGGMVEDYIQVKHGRKKPQYEHEVMEEVLAETHGVMVYQEQVMRILNRLGGIALANAYSCIKAISKKKLEMIAKYREEFIEGAFQKGMAKKKAEEVFGLIEKFAGYGFNKSHSTAYALIAYMTAYLKAHYKVEFMAALLSSDIPGRNFKKKDSLVEHIEDCHRMGMEVTPPDVNRSDVEFAVGDGKIFYALSAIKGCGGAASAAIVKARKCGPGPYRSLFDFCQRLDPGQVNRTAIESLVKAGAFDSLGGRRSQWFAAIDRALQGGAAAAADRRSGQKGLFDDEEEETVEAVIKDLPDVPEWEQKDRLAKEKEVLGFYLSSHPLAEHAKKLRAYCSHTTVEAAALKHRAEVMIGGMIASIKHSHTKNPKPGAPSRYAMFDLEDTAGMMRCICWPEQFAQFGELIQPEMICVLKGAIDKRAGSEEANMIINEVIPIGDLEARYTRGILIRMVEESHGVKKLEMLYEILRGYPGEFRWSSCLACRRAADRMPLRQVPHCQQLRDARPRGRAAGDREFSPHYGQTGCERCAARATAVAEAEETVGYKTPCRQLRLGRELTSAIKRGWLVAELAKPQLRPETLGLRKLSHRPPPRGKSGNRSYGVEFSWPVFVSGSPEAMRQDTMDGISDANLCNQEIVRCPRGFREWTRFSNTPTFFRACTERCSFAFAKPCNFCCRRLTSPISTNGCGLKPLRGTWNRTRP